MLGWATGPEPQLSQTRPPQRGLGVWGGPNPAPAGGHGAGEQPQAELGPCAECSKHCTMTLNCSGLILLCDAAPEASGCSALPGVLGWLGGLQRCSRVPLGMDPELLVPRLGLTQLCPTASCEARGELLPYPPPSPPSRFLLLSNTVRSQATAKIFQLPPTSSIQQHKRAVDAAAAPPVRAVARSHRQQDVRNVVAHTAGPVCPHGGGPAAP